MVSERIQGWPRLKKLRFGRVASDRPTGVRYLLERGFTALEQERKWVTDITVIATSEDKLSCAWCSTCKTT